MAMLNNQMVVRRVTPFYSHDINGHATGTDWLEVPTIYEAYVLCLCKGIYPIKYGLIWYSTSTLGSWNSHWHDIPIIFQPGYQSKLWDLRYLRTAFEWMFYSPSHVGKFIRRFWPIPKAKLPGWLRIMRYTWFNIRIRFHKNSQSSR